MNIVSKRVVFFAVVLTIFAVSNLDSSHGIEIKSGKRCQVLNERVSVGTTTYICSKVGSKLVWIKKSKSTPISKVPEQSATCEAIEHNSYVWSYGTNVNELLYTGTFGIKIQNRSLSSDATNIEIRFKYFDDRGPAEEVTKITRIPANSTIGTGLKFSPEGYIRDPSFTITCKSENMQKIPLQSGQGRFSYAYPCSGWCGLYWETEIINSYRSTIKCSQDYWSACLIYMTFHNSAGKIVGGATTRFEDPIEPGRSHPVGFMLSTLPKKLFPQEFSYLTYWIQEPR